MKEEELKKLMEKLEHIEDRLATMEQAREIEVQKIQTTLESLAAEQQNDIVDNLLRLDAKLTAVLEAQKLNFEILKFFSADSVQH